MKLAARVLLFFLLTVKTFSAELTWDAYGHYRFDKVFDISEERKFYTLKNKSVVLTNTGINGKSECGGHMSLLNGADTGTYFICKMEDSNGDFNYSEFNTTRGDSGTGVHSFTIISGTGRWEELVGQKCSGAYSQITGFDNNMEASYFWKGKCDIPDKTFDRFVNFKKE